MTYHSTNNVIVVTVNKDGTLKPDGERESILPFFHSKRLQRLNGADSSKPSGKINKEGDKKWN